MPLATIILHRNRGCVQGYLHEHEQLPCIPHKHHSATNTKAYPKSKFTYDEKSDCYVCPRGVVLKRQSQQEAFSVVGNAILLKIRRYRRNKISQVEMRIGQQAPKILTHLRI